MSASVLTARRLLLVALVLPLGACEWFSDFKRQPSVVTWESVRPDSLGVRGSPQGSVPTTGTAMAAYSVSYFPGFAQIDSMAGIPNPTPISEASLANGRKYFTINCMPCHGEKADGQGTVVKYGFPPITLQNDQAKGRSDGYIFGMIRNGRGLMPTYNRIEEPDRWDVVNYLRMLQGKVTGMSVATTPLAPPGVTGEMLPGATRLGPTHPVPYRPATPPTADSARRATPPNAETPRRGPGEGGA